MENSEPQNEKKPSFDVYVNDKSYEFNQQNASLYTFLGRNALDHIWLENHVDENGVAQGTRFWREAFQGDDVFNGLAVFMVQNEFEAHLHLPEVAESDMESYIRFQTSTDGGIDNVPDDWL